jgi:hypothetical protein
MHRKLILALLPLTLAGCFRPFTSRLDEANARAAALQEQLVIANAKLDEAMRILAQSDARVAEANRTYYRMEDRLADIDRKAGTMETGFRKLLGIKGPEEPE